MLRLSEEKMSKSLGNIERLRDALDAHGAETFCAFLAGAHYRSPVDYTDAALEQARRSNESLREALRSARRYAAAGGDGTDAAIALVAGSAAAAFDAAMADDLGTPQALSSLHGLRTALNSAVAEGSAAPGAVAEAADQLVSCLDVLGLAGLDPGGPAADEAPAEVRALLVEREEARRARDFARADAARDRIASAGPRRTPGASRGRTSSTASSRCVRRCAAGARSVRSSAPRRRARPCRGSPPRACG
jgi:cysteinyl-tRNA synthetase